MAEDNKSTAKPEVTTSWGQAKRLKVVHKGKEMMAREFVRLVAKSLPYLERDGVAVDHQDCLKAAFMRRGLTGMTLYEAETWRTYRQLWFEKLTDEISPDAQKHLRTYGKSRLKLNPDKFWASYENLQNIERAVLAGQRGNTSLVMDEIDTVYKKLGLKYKDETST